MNKSEGFVKNRIVQAAFKEVIVSNKPFTLDIIPKVRLSMIVFQSIKDKLEMLMQQNGIKDNEFSIEWGV